MQIFFRFILWTLILSVGVFVTMAIPFLQVANNLLWFFSTVLIGGGIALVAKNCGRGALLLAIPISVLLANAVVVRIWPPQVRHNIFRAFNEVARRDGDYQQLRRQLLPVTTRQLKVSSPLQHGWKSGNRTLDIANGITLELFATGLVSAHGIAIDKNGILFVSLPHIGQIVSLHDEDGDGIAERSKVFAHGLDKPTGLAFKDDVLCVATATELLSLVDSNHDYCADSRHVMTDQLLAFSHHWEHALVLGADNQLYVSVGGEDNSFNWQQAAVLRVQDNGELRLYSSGLYDCRGLAVHPQSGSLWASENSPETIGYFVHPDELNVLRANGDYGWPCCYGNRQPDAKLGSVNICLSTEPSLMKLPAHSTPGGITFGARLRGADYFKNMLYMALQGTQSGKRQQGFRLMGIPLAEDGRITGWGIDLVMGWSNDGQPWGQPTDCSVGEDGCLYLSDKMAGAIYRLSFADV